MPAELRPQTTETDYELDCVLPDESLHPEAHRLAREIFDLAAVRSCMVEPEGKCADVAKVLQRHLQRKGFTPQVRGVLLWKNLSDKSPDNHIVVTLTLQGHNYVIDPTAEQFNCRPMLVPEQEWIRRFSRARRTRAIVYHDYPNVTRAETYSGPFYDGPVQSFSGGTIMNMPEWYAKSRQPETGSNAADDEPQ